MFYIGIDVSKAKLDCSLLMDVTNNKRKSKVVINSTTGIFDLLNWTNKQHVPNDELHAILEGTGVYHEQAAQALHDAGVRVSIVNPAQVRNFAFGLAIRNKTDDMDSFVLARYGALVEPKIWIPPSKEARTLQALLKRREAIAQDLIRENNRLEKADSTDTSIIIRQSITDSIEFLKIQLTKIKQDIDDHTNNHTNLKEDLELLQSIPAVGPQVSNHLLAVIHNHYFDTSEKLTAYLGLVPVQRQSGSSISARTHISKAGPPHIRAILFMAAITATRYNSHIKALYLRLLERGKSKRSALCAAMRKLVQLCFGVLKTRQSYQENYAHIS
ncbi:MAG: IS110 family transposase [Methylococcaceae bacterium]